MTDDTPQTAIDFDHLNQYVGGDADLTLEVFGLFKNQVDIWGKALVADADDETWAGVTHALKGSARAVGAVDLAEICQRAEGLTGENSRPGAREVAVNNIETQIELVMIDIQRWEYRHQMQALRAD